MSGTWDEIGLMLRELAAPGSAGLASGDVMALCSSLEHALADPDRSSLREAADVLARGFAEALATASPDVRAAVTGEGGSPDLVSAYLMGQVTMAQAIAANAYAARADSSFAETVSDGRHAPLASLLLDDRSDLDGLVDGLGWPRPEVDAVLRELLVIGAVDHVRLGSRTVFFLTPPGRAVAEAMPAPEVPPADPTP